MPGRNRRSRRFRVAFPRQVRLAISAGVLALLILCVVLILRGCAGGGDASLDVPAAGTQQQVQDQPSAEQQGQPAVPAPSAAIQECGKRLCKNGA